MAQVDLLGGNGIGGSALGTPLQQLLMASEIQPGSPVGYQLAKLLYSYHPMGLKMCDAPIQMAQSQQREVSVTAAPDKVVQAFLDQRKLLRVDRHIANLTSVSRRYGVGTMALIVKGDVKPNQPLDLATLAKAVVGFNVLDPLNTSGSIGVLTQNPNDIAFQNTADQVSIAGVAYHSSRTCVLINEAPIYIEYSSSAFGFTGRSIYQRPLFPLKTFVQTMRTDDMVVRKAGVIIAKIATVGSKVDELMRSVLGQKRAVAQQAGTEDVLSIGAADDIASLNLQNLEGPYGMARKNCIDNIAAAASMPAIILNSQTFAEGFGEGTEDAKGVARYVDGVREDMQPAYDFTDRICQHRAWTPEFYETVKADDPETYAGVTYEEAFYAWCNSFKAEWPSLLIEPESERVKKDEVVFNANTKAMETLLPVIDPTNKVKLVTWYIDAFNDAPLLFKTRLDLDIDALEEWTAQQAEAAAQLQAAGAEKAFEESGDEPKPRADSVIKLLGGRK